MVLNIPIVLVFYLLTAGELFAADAAEREVLGFSPDGRYFAFEQFGIQDGSGFPYSEIVLIDLEADKWVEGTPIRVRLEDESQSLQKARRQARDQAEPHLAKMAIENNALILASNSVYQEMPNPRAMTFRTFYTTFGHLEPIDPANENAIGILLDEFVLPTPEGCPIGDTPMAGFALKARRGSEAYVELHRDTTIPPSRGCPLRYSLSDAVALSTADGNTQKLVMLVNVFSFGFEGADRRFIAVPVN
jgi:predicted secreted protein